LRPTLSVWFAFLGYFSINLSKSFSVTYLNIIVFAIPVSIRKSLILGFDFLEFYVGKNLMSILGVGEVDLV